MIGLRGTRVIVVDDEPLEAVPILTGMAKAGIGAAFFEGKEKDAPPPEQRLVGVRLAVLDMDIVGARVDDKSKIAALVGFLEKVLSPENGPYAAITWTKHKELRELFEEAIGRSDQLPRPILIATVEKHEFRRGEREFDVDALAGRLVEELKGASPLIFCQAWEGEASAAASKVTNALSALVPPGGGDLAESRATWKASMLSLMHAIARASAEKHLEQATCIEAISSALTPLHADQMEQGPGQALAGLNPIADEILASDPGLADEQRAKINAMLHVGSPKGDRLVPGGIYSTSADGLASLGVNVESLLSDLVNSSNNTGTQLQWINEVRANSRFVLAEVSAACDHAQKNIRCARFIAGLLVAGDYRQRLKKDGQFFWSFRSLFLGRAGVAAGRYDLVFSSRHVASFEAIAGADLTSSGLTGVGRFRSQALTVVQTWLAGQATRPGLLFLQP